jgi:citrate synthase
MDQSGFDNPPEEWMGAAAAAKLLNVKVATLYSYVSRGLIRTLPAERHRERRYVRSDVERVRARADARLGHAAVAAGALRWGEPVLDSAITELRPEGPAYRGQLAVELARVHSFEQAAELLWTGSLPDAGTRWMARPVPARPVVTGNALALLMSGVALQAARQQERAAASPAAELSASRQLIRAMACWSAGWAGRPVGPVRRAASVAGALASALGARRGAASERAIDEVLVLCADHELNASSFAARVASSAGADLYACILAALATFSGDRHGGEGARVEALISEVSTPRRARGVLRGRVRRGELLPGFGHPLYREGDPRAQVLLETARKLGARGSSLGRVLAVADAAEALGMERPNLDFGLVAVAAALGLPPGASAILFCLGRTAGWTAHIQEQRASGVLLRPRARYVGHLVVGVNE